MTKKFFNHAFKYLSYFQNDNTSKNFPYLYSDASAQALGTSIKSRLRKERTE